MSQGHPRVLDEIARIAEQRELEILDLQMQLEQAAFHIGRFAGLIARGDEQIGVCRAHVESGKASLEDGRSHIETSLGLQRLAGFESNASRSGRKAFQRTLRARQEIDDHLAAYAALAQHLDSVGSFGDKETQVRSLFDKLANNERIDALGRTAVMQNASGSVTRRTIAYAELRDKESEVGATAQAQIKQADDELIPPETDAADPMRVLKKMVEMLTANAKKMAEMPTAMQDLHTLLSMVGSDVEALNQLLGHWQGAAPMPDKLGAIQRDMALIAARLTLPLDPRVAEEHAGKIDMSRIVTETVTEMTKESEDLGAKIKQRLLGSIAALKAYLRRGGG